MLSPEYRGRIKPGKANSLMGMIAGARLTGSIVAFNAYNYFSGEGVSVMDVDLELPGLELTRQEGPSPPGESGPEARREAGSCDPAGDSETRLRKLQALRGDGLITEDEFQRKRAEIMAEKW